MVKKMDSSVRSNNRENSQDIMMKLLKLRILTAVNPLLHEQLYGKASKL